MLSPHSGFLAHSLIWNIVLSSHLAWLSLCVSIEIRCESPRFEGLSSRSRVQSRICAGSAEHRLRGFLGCAGGPVSVGGWARASAGWRSRAQWWSASSLGLAPEEALETRCWSRDPEGAGLLPAWYRAGLWLACPGVRAWACASNLALLSQAQLHTRPDGAVVSAWAGTVPERAVWRWGAGQDRERARQSSWGGPEPRAFSSGHLHPGSGSKPVRVCAVQAQSCFWPALQWPPDCQTHSRGTLSLGSHPRAWGA